MANELELKQKHGRKGRSRKMPGVSGVVADAVFAMERGRGSVSARVTARVASRALGEGARVQGCEGDEESASLGGRGNMRVVLTAWPAEGVELAAVVSRFTVATRDPSDRAHNVHEPGTTLLMNGAAVAGGGGGGRPRRYPRHQITSQGVAFDSAYDGLHSRQSRLASEGAADLGTHTGRAVGGDWQARQQGAGYLAARGLSVRAVVDRNRSAWDCGPMPVW